MSSPPDIPQAAGEEPHLKKEAETEFRGSEYVTYSESHPLAQRRSEIMYVVKESELKRIESVIGDIKPERKAFRTWWSLLLGIAATSGFSLLGFRLGQNVPEYVWDIGLVAFFVTLILGITFFVLDRGEPDKLLRSKQDALDELRFLRSQFDCGDLPQPLPSGFLEGPNNNIE
jgi:hypothetical protein